MAAVKAPAKALLSTPLTPVMTKASSSSSNRTRTRSRESGTSSGQSVDRPTVVGTGIAQHKSIDLTKLEPKILYGPLYCRAPTHWTLGTGCLTETHLVFVGHNPNENSAFSIPLESIVVARMLNIYESDYEPNVFSIVVKGTAKPVFQALDAIAQSEWVFEINEMVASIQSGILLMPRGRIKYPPPPPSAPLKLPLQMKCLATLKSASEASSSVTFQTASGTETTTA